MRSEALRQRGGDAVLRNLLHQTRRCHRVAVRGNFVTGISLLIASLLIESKSVDGATKCLEAVFKYSSDSGCRNKRFHVHRCSESAEALNAYMERLDLNNVMTPNECKILWLRGCAKFYNLDRFVVVPKDITCNKEVCDQSSMHSNCVNDKHCEGIDSVTGGPWPAQGAVWPFASDPSVSGSKDDGLLPRYRPCCSFYERHCNGASCMGRDGPGTCPLQIAMDSAVCVYDGNCWMAADAPRVAVPLLLALAASLFSLMSVRR